MMLPLMWLKPGVAAFQGVWISLPKKLSLKTFGGESHPEKHMVYTRYNWSIQCRHGNVGVWLMGLTHFGA